MLLSFKIKIEVDTLSYLQQIIGYIKFLTSIKLQIFVDICHLILVNQRPILTLEIKYKSIMDLLLMSH